MNVSVQEPELINSLRLCIRIYLASRERCYVSNLKGGKALFTNWYTEGIEKISDYFPTTCLCGHRICDYGSSLISSCDVCSTHHCSLDYELNCICDLIQVPLPKLKHLFALELEYGYKTSEYQLLLPFTSTRMPAEVSNITLEFGSRIES